MIRSMARLFCSHIELIASDRVLADFHRDDAIGLRAPALYAGHRGRHAMPVVDLGGATSIAVRLGERRLGSGRRAA